MVFTASNRVRLNASELNRLRAANARKGFVVNQVHTRAELITAIAQSLSPSNAERLEAFLETAEAVPEKAPGGREVGP